MNGNRNLCGVGAPVMQRSCPMFSAATGKHHLEIGGSNCTAVSARRAAWAVP